jgi:pilus assembly protein CpaE
LCLRRIALYVRADGMNALIVCESPALAARLGEPLARLGVSCAMRSMAATEPGALPDLGGEGHHLVFLAVGRVFPPHFELIRRLRLATKGALVVASSIPDHTPVMQAVRAGADDFVDLGGDIEAELRQLVDRLRQLPQSSASNTRLITVLPSSDASDANVLAVNLAVAIAGHAGACELLDFHLRGGDLAQLLGLSPRHTLADLISQKGGVDQAVFEQAVTPHASGARLLAGPRLFHQYSDANDQSQQILSLARATGNFVVLNAEDVDQAESLRVLKASDSIILTTRLDLISLSRATQYVAHLAERGLGPHAIHVAAMCTGRRAEVPAREAQRVLGACSLDCIPDDALAIMASINVGEPLVQHSPRSAPARAIEQLVCRLIDASPTVAPAPARSKLSFLLRRKTVSAPAAAPAKQTPLTA